ncbi:MAG: hypothetical protein D6757_08335 [Alphaproteobacteria bacterium]|nr:MAG: hypothetical protein D6757_08335 [Alphaproteobacteria bacterium]
MPEIMTAEAEHEERRRQAAGYALAAAALLLNPPNEQVQAQLRAAGMMSDQPLESLRQSFYDRFCIPQSGLYVPPFEHVFRRREKVGKYWHFPPARFGGGCAVEQVYERYGFEHTRVKADPILSAPHLPGDHLGFMLAFIGWALRGMAEPGSPHPEIVGDLRTFVAMHLKGWAYAYCDLLQESEPDGYAAAVGEAVREAIDEIRACLAGDVGTAAVPL